MPGLSGGKSRFFVCGNISENLSKELVVFLSVVAAEAIWFAHCTYTGLGKEGYIFFLVVFVAGTGIHCCSVKRATSGG